MKAFLCREPDDTEKLGERIGRLLEPGAVLALQGGLGAGKTCFVRGLARGLDIDESITSPTYTIANEYSGRLDLFHLDAYRLRGAADFEMLDASYYLEGEAVCVIEWSEIVADLLPENAISIKLEVGTDGSRIIQIDNPLLEDSLR